MSYHPLDNAIWNSLNSFHADQSVGGENARRYRPDIAPFMGIPEVSPETETALIEIAQPGERVCILKVAPSFGPEWQVEKSIDLLQFIWDHPADSYEETGIQNLTAEHLDAMLDLTALVYPAYFRKGTAELGSYVGIFDGEQLIAMAGIRFALPGFREISAICTHPDHRGRGYARRLTQHLVKQIIEGGNQPFLHTESYNEIGRAMYGGMGFTVRAEIPFWILTRLPQ